MDIDKEFISYWKKSGDQNEDFVHRFVCYYIIFNYLYEAYCFEHHNQCSHVKANNECLNCSERTKIKRFLKSGKIQTMNFQPLDKLDDDSELLKEKVHPMRNGEVIENPKYDNQIEPTLQSPQQIKEILFMNIYQVRCNLFHGEKAMKRERDKNLVQESAIILKYFLEEYLKDA